jgi:hypothetical protein
MAQRMVRFSDLTNKIIDDDTVVRIVVEQHPALENGAVEVEAAQDEADLIRKSALSVVGLKLYQDDGSEPEAVTMEIEEFNNLATGGMDMAEVIRRAKPAYPQRRQARPVPASTVDKLDYSTLEHAGKPHRGKTTDAERETVRDNLPTINERLKREGIRTIDLNNVEHVARYGLETLAKEASHAQQ